MKVAIMPNLTRENAYEITCNLCKTLDKLKIEYSFFGDCSKFAPEFSSKDSIDNDTDCIIAIGGDGTMMRAAKSALPLNIPILGVNAGNLAYLMSINNDDMFLLSKLLTGEYILEDRFVLELKVSDEHGNTVFNDYCINDVVFARGAEIKLASFDFYCDDRFVNRYTSDGLIFSTPTGSTAYSLSAGGPIVDPRVDGILMTPICPHSLEERALLFSSNSILRLDNPSANVLFSCDGCESISFSDKHVAMIKKADKKITLIRLKDDNFIDILNKKMKNK